MLPYCALYAVSIVVMTPVRVTFSIVAPAARAYACLTIFAGSRISPIPISWQPASNSIVPLWFFKRPSTVISSSTLRSAIPSPFIRKHWIGLSARSPIWMVTVILPYCSLYAVSIVVILPNRRCVPRFLPFSSAYAAFTISSYVGSPTTTEMVNSLVLVASPQVAVSVTTTSAVSSPGVRISLPSVIAAMVLPSGTDHA